MRFWLCVGVIAFAACSSDNAENNCQAGPRSGYPAGPYGLTEGSVLTNLEFLTPEVNFLSLADVHQRASSRLLLINTAAEWCPSCIEEQPALKDLHQRFASDGLTVLVAVFEDANYQAADSGVAEDWRARFGLTFDVVADPTFVLGAYYDSTLTPMNMLVNVCTMEIVKITTGWDQSVIEALIEANL